jgi:hypothetical protein
MSRCIAYREEQVNGSMVYVPCGRRFSAYRKKNKSRFCRQHEQAYREIILGILQQEARRDQPGNHHRAPAF